MTDFETLQVDLEGPVASLRLNRPDRLNAMNASLLRELAEAARAIGAADGVRCVVVSGNGRAFSAGADLALIAGLSSGEADPHTQADLGRVMADAVEAIPAVTIAAIHGWCVGGALVLASACDLRVAADDARFSIPEVDLGIPLAWGGIPRLVREIGPALTKELVMTCREFDAAEAKAAGFLNRVVPAAEVMATATQLAESIAAKPRVAVLPTKRHTDAVTAQMVGIDHAWADADGLLTAMADPDAQAARQAYLAARGR